MDDKDQTQLHPSDSSARKKRPGAKPRPSAEQHTATQAMLSPAQTADSLAQSAQDMPTTDVLAEQTQAVTPAKSRPSRSKTKVQVQPAPPPQPILFAGRESGVIITEPIARHPARRQRLGRTRRWLRSRTGRVVIPLLTLLLGLAVGLTSVIWYGLSGEGPLVAVVPVAHGNLIIDANQDFVSQLVRNNLLHAGLPGKVQNVRIELEHGAKIIVQGDDVYSVLFVNVTRHFTIDVQPYVQNCLLQVRITHADLAGIPVTTFVQTFQNKINQQLAKKPAGLPSGFAYCTVGVSTEPGGMYITYRATPVSQ